MLFKAVFLLLVSIFTTAVFGQTRTITGKVIDENLHPVYKAGIYSVDTCLLVTTDLDGAFKISIPDNTKSLIIASIAMEWRSIELTGTCSTLEIILLSSGSYDFMSAGKVDRLRKKEFDKLPDLHQSSFEKGIFKMDKPCYMNHFISIKKELREIHKRRTQAQSN
jgi:hypothetical protein